MSSIDTATQMRVSTDPERLWRMLIQGRDHLRLMLQAGDGSAASWEANPGSAGDERWDVLLAALAAHEFDAVGEALPGWCATVTRLDAPWISVHPFLDPHEVVAATPTFLAAHNIFVPARDLVSA